MGVDTSLLVVYGLKVDGKIRRRINDVCEAEGIEYDIMNDTFGVTLFDDVYCGKWAYIGIPIAYIGDDEERDAIIEDDFFDGLKEKFKEGILKLPEKLHFLANLDSPKLYITLYYT